MAVWSDVIPSWYKISPVIIVAVYAIWSYVRKFSLACARDLNFPREFMTMVCQSYENAGNSIPMIWWCCFYRGNYHHGISRIWIYGGLKRFDTIMMMIPPRIINPMDAYRSNTPVLIEFKVCSMLFWVIEEGFFIGMGYHLMVLIDEKIWMLVWIHEFMSFRKKNSRTPLK